MLKICIYKDGRITKEEVDRSEARGWMQNNSIGGFININTKNSQNNHEVVFLDGNKKAHHLKKSLIRKEKRLISKSEN